jgi:hypothetical protein
MFLQFGRLVRVCALVTVLQLLAVPLLADSTECADAATGSQSGDSYTLVGQDTKTVTYVYESDGPACGTWGGTLVTVTETYTVGYYWNQRTGETALVNCESGQVLSWT